jgi:hypothetical protein
MSDLIKALEAAQAGSHMWRGMVLLRFAEPLIGLRRTVNVETGNLNQAITGALDAEATRRAPLDRALRECVAALEKGVTDGFLPGWANSAEQALAELERVIGEGK